MNNLNTLKNFYKNKKILILGHTGFKGSWLSIWLREMGAEVVGYSIDSHYEKGIYELANMSQKITYCEGDVNNIKILKHVFKKFNPEIVFHLVAQALVRESYDSPQKTFETNIMGTVNVLECVRTSNSVKSVVIITSDKCYKNKEQVEGYKESDELGGEDTYSASKACAELVTNAYQESFFKHSNTNIATVRAGNVIGGGDWSKDRLIVDAVKSIENNKPLEIRNPNATRPWQFVLEPLRGYLMVAKKLYTNEITHGAWNFGPKEESVVTVGKLMNIFKEKWDGGFYWLTKQKDDNKKESNFLVLDCTKAKNELGWEPVLDINQSISLVIDWYKRYQHEEVYNLVTEQIEHYESILNRGQIGCKKN